MVPFNMVLKIPYFSDNVPWNIHIIYEFMRKIQNLIEGAFSNFFS